MYKIYKYEIAKVDVICCVYSTYNACPEHLHQCSSTGDHVKRQNDGRAKGRGLEKEEGDRIRMSNYYLLEDTESTLLLP